MQILYFLDMIESIQQCDKKTLEAGIDRIAMQNFRYFPRITVDFIVMITIIIKVKSYTC